MYRRAIACICCCVVALLMVGGGAYAEASSPAQGSATDSGALVYADDIEVGSGSELAIPVKIKGNPGLMGFRISAAYDLAALTFENVTSADLTSEGLFNSSLGQKKDSFDAVWSAAEAVEGDGELFILYVKLADSFEGTTNVKLSYKQADTFDGDFKDVKLDCKDIVITSAADGQKQTLDTDPAAEHLTTEISNQVTVQTDSKLVKGLIDDALAKNKVSSIAELSGDQAASLLKDIVQHAGSAGADTKQVEALLKRADEMAKAEPNANIASVHKAALEQIYEAATGETEYNGGPSTGVIVVVAIVVLAAIAGVIAFTRRNRGREKR